MNDAQAPAAPDPVKTAEAQGTMNQNTATTQQLLNMTNQVGPDGSLTYNQTGNNSFTGADGKSYTVPQFTATTTLSPEEQKLQALSNQTRQNLGQIGVDQSISVRLDLRRSLRGMRRRCERALPTAGFAPAPMRGMLKCSAWARPGTTRRTS
jgi:hypothetical protein